MGCRQNKIDLFSYRDYRDFLRDWYAHAKATRRGYSHRAFAMKAGFKTSNFMMLVIQGKRNLTEASLKKMIKGLEFNKQESEFFRNLAYFTQAQTHEDKNDYYQRLLRSNKFRELRSIEEQQYQYYSDWYHPVVRELVVSDDFNGDPSWIAARIYPKVTSSHVLKSIELLEQLGFIKRNGDDRWKQASSLVSTGPQLQSVVVHNYHKVLLEHSLEMMDALTMQDRDVSAMTLGVKRGRIKELREKIRAFRKDIMQMVSDDTSPEDVVQLNIQFYPVTQGKREKD